eukprot:1294248-Ditylum_brightwellii.AAC.1
MDLDDGDRSYDDSGGVDSVRADLCRRALNDVLNFVAFTIEEETKKWENEREGDEEGSVLKSYAKQLQTEANAALQALSVKCSLRGSRETFVEQTAIPLSRLYNVLRSIAYADDDHNDEGGNGNDDANASSTTTHTTVIPTIKSTATIPMNTQTAFLIVQQAAKVAEIRTLDALLRILRDRLLLTTSHLSRTVKYWKWSYWSVDDTRRNLALATASYKRETERLGQ